MSWKFNCSNFDRDFEAGGAGLFQLLHVSEHFCGAAQCVHEDAARIDVELIVVLSYVFCLP